MSGQALIEPVAEEVDEEEVRRRRDAAHEAALEAMTSMFEMLLKEKYENEYKTFVLNWPNAKPTMKSDLLKRWLKNKDRKDPVLVALSLAKDLSVHAIAMKARSSKKRPCPSAEEPIELDVPEAAIEVACMPGQDMYGDHRFPKRDINSETVGQVIRNLCAHLRQHHDTVQDGANGSTEDLCGVRVVLMHGDDVIGHGHDLRKYIQWSGSRGMIYLKFDVQDTADYAPLYSGQLYSKAETEGYGSAFKRHS